MAPQRDRPAGTGCDGIDDGGHFLELPVDRIARAIVAGAKASAIHRKAGHRLPQLRHERVEPGVVAQRAVLEDERGPIASHPDGK